MASFLSPNSYSFDKFARLQDYFMSSLGQTEGFQDRICNTNEYGMAVLHEPFYQDNSSSSAAAAVAVIPTGVAFFKYIANDMPERTNEITTAANAIVTKLESSQALTVGDLKGLFDTMNNGIPDDKRQSWSLESNSLSAYVFETVNQLTGYLDTNGISEEQIQRNTDSYNQLLKEADEKVPTPTPETSTSTIPVTEEETSTTVGIPVSYSQNNVNRMQAEWNAQKTSELEAALASAKADADKLQAEAIAAKEAALKAEYDAQILEANTKATKAANNLSQANTLRTLAETKLAEANTKWTESESKLKIAQELSAALENEKKTLLKWDNKNSNSKLAYSELSYASGNALNNKYIPVSPVLYPASLSTKQNNKGASIASVASSASKVNLNKPLVKSVLSTPIPKNIPDTYKFTIPDNLPESTENKIKSLMFQLNTNRGGVISKLKNATNDLNTNLKLQKQTATDYNNKCVPKNTNDKTCKKLITEFNEQKNKISKAESQVKLQLDSYKDTIEQITRLSKQKSRFWDIIWRNPLEAFTVDEGLNSNLAENKISASNKKPTNKPKSTTSKMANNRRNNNRMREEDDMETTSTMMADEDMETTTTRHMASKKKAKKPAKRQEDNMEEETTTSTMMAEEEGDMDESVDETTERGPDGDMESEEDTSEPTEEVTEGFSGSRTYRFGHLSTALKALLLALLFWLLTNTAGSAYVAKLAKRVGASTCVVQVILFFVLAYIALML